MRIQINPPDFNIYGDHRQGDRDFWGAPMFRVKVWLEVVKVATQQGEADRLVVKVDANWREENPDHTTFQAVQSHDVVTLNPGQHFEPFDDSFKVEEPERKIHGTNQGLTTVYQGTSTGNRLVDFIQAEADKKGQVDTPQLIVIFRRNIDITING